MKKIIWLLLIFSLYVCHFINASELLKQDVQADEKEVEDIIESLKTLYIKTVKINLDAEEEESLPERKEDMLKTFEFQFDQEKWMLEEIIFNLQKEKLTRLQIYQKIKDIPHMALIIKSSLLLNRPKIAPNLTEDEFAYNIAFRINFSTIYKCANEIRSIFLDVHTKNIRKSREAQLDIILEKLLPVGKNIYKGFD